MDLPGLNLRQHVLQEWWQSKSKKTAQMLEWMKTMEVWNLDEHKKFSEALYELTKIMEATNRDKILKHSQALIDIMAYMSPARALRILEWGDSQFNKNGGFSLSIVEQALNNIEKPENMLLIDRLRVLQGYSLLSNIFTESRATLIKQALLKQIRNLD